MKPEKLKKLTDGLEPETVVWIRDILRNWELEEHHIRLLTLMGRHWDRAQNARRIIEKDKATYSDRFGCPKVRPEVLIEKDSSICFARLLRELALDVEPPKETLRPAAFVGKGKR